MTKIERVIRDIQNLQDFYKKTKSLRKRIRKKGLERSQTKQASTPDALKSSRSTDKRAE